MVYLQGTRQEIVTKDGKKTLIDVKPGMVGECDLRAEGEDGNRCDDRQQKGT